MNTPLISIITVCYNIKDEIKRTCESIVNQTYQNFEWIVVDGASTDGTVEILSTYKDKMHIFISEKDTGIYNAMNKGILKARGKWLIFLNGGDAFSSSDILEKFSQLSGCYKYADIIYGDVNEVNTHGTKKRIEYPYPLTKAYFYHGETINHQTSFIKRELFNKYGLYDESFRIASDWEKWIVFIINNCKFMKWEYIVSDFFRGGASSTQLDLLNQEIKEIEKSYFIAGDLDGAFYQGQKQILLFNKIPFLSIKRKCSPHKITIKLFKFIPIYGIKKKNGSYIHYLFTCIPFLTIRGK